MTTNSTTIKVKDILPNPLNLRSMNDAQIEIIAECIKRDGLLTPLVVYKDGSKYVLLSGHKRLEALRRIGIEETDAVIYKKPKSDIHEREILAQANIHRNSPEELVSEVKSAENCYNTMDDEYRKEWSALLENLFIKYSENNPNYQKDPRNFINNNFKPKYEYIRATTGLDISNSTVKRILKECQEKDIDAPEEVLPFDEESEEKEKKVKKITYKNVLKAAETLYGLLQVYDLEDLDEDERQASYIVIDEVKKGLVDLQTYLGGE